MKKFIVLLMVALFPFMGMAQSGHLNFLGIPMGDYDTFVSKLKTKGFTYKGMSIYEGFVASESCDLFVPQNDCVICLTRTFSRNSLSELNQIYNKLQSILRNKYAFNGKEYVNQYGSVVLKQEGGKVTLMYFDETNLRKLLKTPANDDL